jgi:hypothetical protein
MDRASLEKETFTSLKKLAGELGVRYISHLRAKDKNELIRLILAAQKGKFPKRSTASPKKPTSNDSNKTFTLKFLRSKTLNELRTIARNMDFYDPNKPKTTAKKPQLIDYIYNHKNNDKKAYAEKLEKQRKMWEEYDSGDESFYSSPSRSRSPSPKSWRYDSPSSSRSRSPSPSRRSWRYDSPSPSRSRSPSPSRRSPSPPRVAEYNDQFFEGFYTSPTKAQCDKVLCAKNIRNKKDYKLWAAKNHPDKVPAEKSMKATQKFKKVSNCVSRDVYCSK